MVLKFRAELRSLKKCDLGVYTVVWSKYWEVHKNAMELRSSLFSFKLGVKLWNFVHKKTLYYYIYTQQDHNFRTLATIAKQKLFSIKDLCIYTSCLASTVHISKQPGSSKVVTTWGLTPLCNTHRAPFFPWPLTVTSSTSQSDELTN